MEAVFIESSFVKSLTLLLLLFCSLSPYAHASAYSDYLETLVKQANQQELWKDNQWLKLGHWDSGLFGYSSNIASTETFFISKEGSSSPRSELEADLRAFFSTEKRAYPALVADPKRPETFFVHEYPRCQLPARFLFLKRKLNIDLSKIPPIDCVDFDKFKKNLGAKSVSVVFSNFFLDSPASAFGHSLIRINKSPLGASSSEHQELLDYGINFAAERTTPNPILYAAFGLMGFFRGTYSKIPYYYKVREYNDFESRDLWSYDLNLTPDEVEMLVAHIWELGPNWNRYWYFFFNCGNAILYAIEAAAPRYPISENLKIYIIPSDTIKTLLSIPGLVTKVSYRPSARAEFYSRLKQLNPKEKDDLSQFIQSDYKMQTLSGQDKKTQAEILDTALDYYDFRMAKELLVEGSDISKKRQSLLASRASLGVSSKTVEVPAPAIESPHLGHRSMRTGFEGGTLKSNVRFAQYDLRFALHDSLDAGQGYPDISQVEFFNFKFRYLFEPKQFQAEELNLFRLLALSPVDSFVKNTSWRFELGLKRFYDKNCQDNHSCFGGSAEYGLGYSAHLGSYLIPYAFLETEVDWAHFIGSGQRIGAGPSLGMLFKTEHWGWKIDSKYQYMLFSYFPSQLRLQSELRWNPDLTYTFGIKTVRYETEWENSISASRFF